MAEQLLELALEVSRPTIKIDGTQYEMRTPEEFTWKENKAITAQGQRFSKLANKMNTEEGLTDAETNEIEQLSGTLVNMVVVDLDDSTAAKLKPAHQVQILETFIGLSRKKNQEAPTEAAETEGAKTSPEQSRGSSASTAENPSTG